MRASVLLLGFAMVACVPTDESLVLGSAEFTITARASERSFTSVDGWSLFVDRYVTGFRTMTIVNMQDTDQCSYRGRGASANIIFDGIVGTNIQSFNGIKPGPCPDVGLRLTMPDDYTRVGEGTTEADLLDLATTGSHTVVTVTATLGTQTKHVRLRFDPGSTTSAFANCRDAIRGAKIEPEGRDVIFVAFDASAFFRDTIKPYADVWFGPFVEADADDDGEITMAELDNSRIFSDRRPPAYLLPTGVPPTSLGQFVRAQFQASLHFGASGQCDGLDAGTNVDE